MTAATLPHLSAGTTDAQPRVRQVGLWLLLASETMLFAAVVAAVAVLRVTNGPMFAHAVATLHRPGALAATALLIAGTIVVRWGSRRASLARGPASVALVVGAVFSLAAIAPLVFQWTSMRAARADGATDAFLSCYLLVAGIAVVHVLFAAASVLAGAVGIVRHRTTRDAAGSIATYHRFVTIAAVLTVATLYFN